MINIDEYRGLQKYDVPLPIVVHNLVEKLDCDSIFRLMSEIDADQESIETIVSRYEIGLNIDRER